MEHYGVVDASSTIYVYFTTHDTDGAAVAPSSAFEAADVRIYKNGSATQRSSESGYTMTSPFDTVTGLHLLAVDLSDNTDAGFYAAGSRYTIILVPDETVDAFSVVRVLADFTIGPPAVNVSQFGGTAGTFSSGRPEVNTTHAAGTAWGSGAITAASIAADAITAAKIADDAIDAGAIATGAITAAKFAAGAIDAAAIANGAIDAATFAADVDAEILSYLVDDATRIDASALNTASTAVGSNGSGLTEAGGTGDHLTALPWNAAWDAEVQSEVDDALVAQRLDELLNADSDIDGAAPPTVGSVFHELMTKTTGSFTYDQTTDSLEAVRDRGDAAWTTATGFSTLDAAGVRTAVGLASANLDTQLGTIDTNVDSILADTGTDGVIVASVATGAITAGAIAADAIGASELAADAVAEIADAVWDEATSGHTTAGTFGQAAYAVRANTAQAGAGTTITLDASASATDDIYNNCLLVITAGTGAGQARFISDYNGTTKVATVATWATNPSSDSVFVILPFGAIPGATAPTAAEVADAVWDEAQADHVAAGSFGLIASEIADILVDTAEIGAAGAGLTEAGGTGDHLTAVPWNASWDAEVQSECADALTAYGAATSANVSAVETDTQDIQSRLPAALVGGRIDANVGAISADATAADNLEAALDGTGGVTITAGLTGNVTGNLSGSVGSVTGAVGSVAGNVDGNVTGSVGSLATQAKADVQAEAEEAMRTYNLDHLIQAAVDTDFATTVHLNSVIGHLADNGTSATFDRTTDSLEAVRDRGDAAWTTATGFSTHSASDVWSVGTRVLTAGTNIALAKGTGVTGFTDIDAAGVRTAVGLASANLDTQLSTIDSEIGVIDGIVDSILADTGTDGVVLSAATANQIADALLDRTAGVEANRTLRQALRLILATAVGKLSGAATTTVTIRDTNDGVDRVTATVDSSGNRTAVTLDAS